MIASVAVFAGSSFGTDPEYSKAAAQLGKAIARRGLRLVYGGGYRGLMGTLAENVSADGGYVTGVLPAAMDTALVKLKRVETELLVVPDMHERKSTMYSLADAFIALPGGIGTLEELSEIYTWKQLGFHSKNVGLLNVNGFWDPLITLLDRMTRQGFLSEEARSVLIAESDIEKLLDRLSAEERSVPAKY